MFNNIALHDIIITKKYNLSSFNFGELMKAKNELVNEIGRFNNKYCKNTKNRICLSERNGKYVKVSKIRGYNDNEKIKIGFMNLI